MSLTNAGAEIVKKAELAIVSRVDLVFLAEFEHNVSFCHKDFVVVYKMSLNRILPLIVSQLLIEWCFGAIGAKWVKIENITINYVNVLFFGIGFAIFKNENNYKYKKENEKNKISSVSIRWEGLFLFL